MTIHLFKNSPRIGLWPCTLFISLLASIPAQAVDKVSVIDASGDGSIYDLKATSTGTLTVCTKPAKSGDRWRVTIGQVNTNGAISAVGTGSTTTSSGCVSNYSVTNGVSYVLIVTWERPMPDNGHFPATVTTQITGPVGGLNGESVTSLKPRPNSYLEGGQGCPADGVQISCGALLTNCNFDSTSDLDTFKFNGTANGAAAVKICGPSSSWWYLYGPAGNYIAASTGTSVGKLASTGTYTIQTQNSSHLTGVYSLALEGVSQAFQCGVPLVFGQTKSGTLDACADLDSFQFVCQANQVVSINIVGPSSSWWYLYGPTGNYIAASTGTSTGKCTTAGTHTIVVSNSSGLTGAYSITLQLVSGP